MDLIAAIRRVAWRGDRRRDRSWFFFFQFLVTLPCGLGEGGGQCGMSVLAPLRKTVGIDQRVRKTSAVTARSDGFGLPVRVRLSLRLSLFVGRRLCPTVALAYLRPPPPPPLPTRPVQRLAAVLVPLPLPPSKPPLASESSLSRHSLRALPLDLFLTHLSL